MNVEPFVFVNNSDSCFYFLLTYFLSKVRANIYTQSQQYLFLINKERKCFDTLWTDMLMVW